MNTVKEQIENYLDLGFSVIPLKPKSKLPLIRWKTFILPKKAVYRYVDRGCNWAIKGGQIAPNRFVYFLDLDDKQTLPKIFKDIPASAPIVSTSRGIHVWLCWNQEVKTRRIEGIEIRGSGAFVVVPPSVHPSGHVYTFLKPLRMPPIMDPSVFIPAPPEPSTETRSSWGTEDPYAWEGNYAGVAQGRRHDRLMQIIGALHAKGKSEMEVLSIVMDWRKRCKPPLSAEEVRVTLHKAYEAWNTA